MNDKLSVEFQKLIDDYELRKSHLEMVLKKLQQELSESREIHRHMVNGVKYKQDADAKEDAKETEETLLRMREEAYRLRISKVADEMNEKILDPAALTDYQRGYIEGLTEYAHWKHGVRYVGTCGKTLQQAVNKFLTGEAT